MLSPDRSERWHGDKMVGIGELAIWTKSSHRRDSERGAFHIAVTALDGAISPCQPRAGVPTLSVSVLVL
jgi:hypothetical protein